MAEDNVENQENPEIEDIAMGAIAGIIKDGQSVTVDGMSVSQVALRDAYYIIQQERKQREARGRMLFRGINLSGMK